MNLADLLDEFNVVIDTAEGLSQLRSLILGLAIRGKLVSQGPNAKLASDLLEKIKEEQARLYDEGKIRKPKDLDPLSENDLPFTIPENWIWERMGNISDVIRGITFPASEKKEEKGPDDILCLKTSNVQDTLEWDDVIYVDESFVKREDQYLQENDIVISMANSYELVGKVALANHIPEKSSFGGFLSVIRPFLFNPLYYFYLLRSDYVQEAFRESSSQTVNIANISLKVMLPIPMPLPPVEEQERIVQKIESLFAEVDELEAKLNRQGKLDEKLQLAVNAKVQQAPDANASKSAWNFITSHFDTLYHTPEAIDNLKKNILNEAVRGRLVPQNPNDEPASELLKKIEAEKQRLYEEGEIRKPKKLPPVKEDEIPFEIPESWEWCRLGKVSTYGNNNSVSPDEIDGDTWVLDLADIEKDTSRIVDFDTFKNRKSKSNKYVFNKGDVLYGKLRPYLNKVVIAVDDGVCTTEIVPLKVLSGMSNKYLLHSLKRQDFLDYVNAITYGTKMPRLGTDDGRKALIPLPPSDEQHRIVRRIEELFALCDLFKVQLEQREKVNDRLVKGLVSEVLEEAGNTKEKYLTKQEIGFLQILCIAYALHVLKQRNMLQGEMGLAKYIYLADRIGEVDTKFKFEQNNFGPYPSNFKRRLFTRSRYFYKAGEEGYEVIDLTSKSNRLFGKKSEQTEQIKKSMQSLANIFEPYKKNRAHKLELLASVCWLVEKTKQTDFETIWEELENWETPKRNDVDKKSELFTQKEVKDSLNYLIENNWDKKLINKSSST